MDHVIWHDVECGGYGADLELWRSLAADSARPAGPVLDLGAGTGRVTLALARDGHEVHALDVDATLLDALRDRAAGLAVTTHVADARSFDLGCRFGLAVAPMQTLQLLGGAAARMRCLAAVRRHLHPGGRLAAAVVTDVDVFDGEIDVPVPDVREVGGVVYASRPVAVRGERDGFVLERVRERVAVDGTRRTSEDRVRLDRLTAGGLEEEGRRAGLTPERRRVIPATDDHVGSEVVVLRA